MVLDWCRVVGATQWAVCILNEGPEKQVHRLYILVCFQTYPHSSFFLDDAVGYFLNAAVCLVVIYQDTALLYVASFDNAAFANQTTALMKFANSTEECFAAF